MFQKDINKVENILKGKFSNVDERLFWENKLLDLKQKEFNAKQNAAIINKAGYVGSKRWH